MDRLAIYLGYEAALLEVDLDGLLAIATNGHPPALTQLREDFHTAMRDHLDGALFNWQTRHWRP